MSNFKVTADGGLNIRSGPGVDHFEVIGQLKQGEHVIVPDPTGWLPIVLEGDTIGWVSAKHLEKVGENESPKTGASATITEKSYDFNTKEGTIGAIKAECVKQGLSIPEQIAYVLATVQHETGGTFKPVREAYYLGVEKAEEYLKTKKYYPYYGRGYVQLTWKDNYKHYKEKLGVDLVGNPDLALDPQVALFILVDGFKSGAFTGKKIAVSINENEYDFVEARRCINGTDEAEEIAEIAEDYLTELKADIDNAFQHLEMNYTDYAWMVWARSKLGLKEAPGGGDNSEIVEWCKLTTLPKSMYRDATAWCSVFVNAAFELNGFRGTRSAAAASWLEWGEELEEPEVGCVVVFSREGGNHVGFFLEEDDTRVKVIGGNQSDAVTEAWYPKSRVRGYRWPAE